MATQVVDAFSDSETDDGGVGSAHAQVGKVKKPPTALSLSLSLSLSFSLSLAFAFAFASDLLLAAVPLAVGLGRREPAAAGGVGGR